MSAVLSLEPIKKMLPEQSGWIKGPANQVIEFPAPALSGTIYYEGLDVGPYKQTGVRVDGKLIQGSTDISMKPDVQCHSFKHQLSLGTGLDGGFWWVEYSSPPLPQITLDVPRPSINNKSIEITAHLDVADLPLGILKDWRGCYAGLDLEIENPEFPPVWDDHNRLKLNTEQCEDGGIGLCPELGGNRLMRTWQWMPAFQLPQTTYAMAYWNNISSEKVPIVVNFAPTIVGAPIVSLRRSVEEKKPPILQLWFLLHNDVAEPSVSILVDKNVNLDKMTEEAQKIYSGYLCPASNGNLDPVSGKKYKAVSKGANDTDIDDLVGNFVEFYDHTIDVTEHWLVVSAYEYVFSICKYSAIQFSWEGREPQHIASSSWVCALAPDSFTASCQPK